MHNYLLKIYGLRRIFDIPTHVEGEELPNIASSIKIEVGDSGLVMHQSDIENAWYENVLLYKFINFLQYLVVLSLVVWPVIYAIVLASIDGSFEWFSSNIFTLTFMFQYILGYIQYNNSAKKLPDIKIINMLYILGLIASIIISAVAVILVIFTDDMNIYTNIYNNSDTTIKVVFLIVLFCTMFYCYSITISNFITFAIIFINHANLIGNYSKKLEEFVNATEDMLITSIITEYSELKENYTNSKNKMNYIFASFTIISSIGSFFMTLNFGTPYISIYNYVDAVFFVLVMAVYVYSIQKVKNSVNDIQGITQSIRFIHKYLERVELESFHFHDAEDIEANTVPINNNILNTNLRTRVDIRTMMNRLSMENTIRENKQDILLNIKEVVTRSMIKGNENANSLDWIILYSVLQSEWEYFQVMGIQFDDVTMIQKSIGVILFILGTLVFNDKVILS